MGYLGAQHILHMSGKRRHRGCEEESKGDNHNANLIARQVARDGEGHSDDPAFEGAVGRLADLAVISGHRGALTIRPRSPSASPIVATRAANLDITLKVPIRLTSIVRQ